MKKLAYVIGQNRKTSTARVFGEVQQMKKLGLKLELAFLETELPEGIEVPISMPTAQVPPSQEGSFQWGWKAFLRTLRKQPKVFFASLSDALRLNGYRPWHIPRALRIWGQAVWVGEWASARDISHLHAHGPSAASTVAMLVSRTSQITWSMTANSPDELQEAPDFYWQEAIESAAFICCGSRFVRGQLMQHSHFPNWHKIELCPPGLDPAGFCPPPFRHKPRIFEVLTVGRLTPPKGQSVLISAIKRLIEQGVPVKLRLVGEGPERKNLQTLVRYLGLEKHVSFEGSVPHHRLVDFYRSADIFAHASFAEGLPTAMMEAMVMAIPVVSTRITGITELIHHQKDGLLVETSEEEALAQTLFRLMDNPDLRQEIGQAGRQRVMEHFHLDQCYRQLTETFRRRLDITSKLNEPLVAANEISKEEDFSAPLRPQVSEDHGNANPSPFPDLTWTTHIGNPKQQELRQQR